MYKEAVDELIYKSFTEPRDLVVVAAQSATAKLANNLYNLPTVLKTVEQALASHEEIREKMAAENAPLLFEQQRKRGIKP